MHTEYIYIAAKEEQNHEIFEGICALIVLASTWVWLHVVDHLKELATFVVSGTPQIVHDDGFLLNFTS